MPGNSAEAELKPSTKEVAQHLVDNFDSTTVRNLDAAIVDAIRALCPGINSRILPTLEGQMRNGIIVQLESRLEDKQSRGAPTRFYFDRDADLLVGILALEDRKGVTGRAGLVGLIKKVLLELSPTEFEKLCCLLLTRFSCEAVERVGEGKRQLGIDLFAVRKMPGLFSVSDINIRIVAQATKEQVSEEKADSLFSAVTKVENRDQALVGILPGWFLDLNRLDRFYVQGMVLTTSTLSSYARKYSRMPNHKIIGLELNDLAQLIVNTDIGAPSANQGTFSSDALKSQICEFE